MNKQSIICGMGEIGKSLYNVLRKQYKIWHVDKDGELKTDLSGLLECYNMKQVKPSEFDILHICFGYSENFVEQVKKYQEEYKPEYTVIHSTVPVGTNRKCNSISSPCLGIHPDLEPGLRTFIKFLGGEKASEVADYFRRAGLKIYLFDQPETSELMKILDTTFYGVCLEYTKDVKKQCMKLGIPFEAWTLWTNNYNEGYQKLGHPEFTRPNLTPIMKKLGGHCILPNTELLDTPFTRFIKELNG